MRLIFICAAFFFFVRVGIFAAPEAIEEVESQKISLDIKGMDVIDVIKMISSEGKLNVIIGKNVTGRVTMFLQNVDLWDALDIVLAANDLAYEQKGDVINIMTERDYETKFGTKYRDKRALSVISLQHAKAANVGQVLSQMKSNIGKIVTNDAANSIMIFDIPEVLEQMEALAKKMDKTLASEVFELNYASAETLSPVVQEILTKDVGNIRIDKRTNKIIVTDYPNKIEQVKNLVLAFDEKTPQVLIDAQIVEIKPSDRFEMGIDWDYWIEKNLRTIGTFKLATGAGNTAAWGTTAVSSVEDFSVIMSALRTIGKTRILSSPRIVALNNQEAKILVGEKDAYITSSISQSASGTTVESQSVNFVDVGVKLYVTPTINKDGFISMKIKPEVSSAERVAIKSGDLSYEVPIVSTSEAETQLILKDGVTLIIAGLRKEQNSKIVKKIPLLGDIPILGFFFRSTSDDTSMTELVVFLTPHIISGEYPTEYTSLTKDDSILKIQENSTKESKKIEIPSNE